MVCKTVPLPVQAVLCVKNQDCPQNKEVWSP